MDYVQELRKLAAELRKTAETKVELDPKSVMDFMLFFGRRSNNVQQK